MKFWFIEQEQALPQPESIDLSDKKGDLSFASAQLIKCQLQTRSIEEKRSLVRIDAHEHDVRQHSFNRFLVRFEMILERGISSASHAGFACPPNQIRTSLVLGGQTVFEPLAVECVSPLERLSLCLCRCLPISFVSTCHFIIVHFLLGIRPVGIQEEEMDIFGFLKTRNHGLRESGGNVAVTDAAGFDALGSSATFLSDAVEGQRSIPVCE